MERSNNEKIDKKAREHSNNDLFKRKKQQMFEKN